MVDLTATAWTITATGTVIHSKERTTQVTLTIASGNAGVYPLSGGIGIPLPTTPGSYGMARNLDYIILYEGIPANVATQGHYRYQFIASGPGVRIFTTSGPAELASTVAPANTDAIVLKGEAHGW